MTERSEKRHILLYYVLSFPVLSKTFTYEFKSIPISGTYNYIKNDNDGLLFRINKNV